MRGVTKLALILLLLSAGMGGTECREDGGDGDGDADSDVSATASYTTCTTDYVGTCSTYCCASENLHYPIHATKTPLGRARCRAAISSRR